MYIDGHRRSESGVTKVGCFRHTKSSESGGCTYVYLLEDVRKISTYSRDSRPDFGFCLLESAGSATALRDATLTGFDFLRWVKDLPTSKSIVPG